MTYTPDAADVGYYLRATASYDDGEGSGRMAVATTASTVTVTAADPLLAEYDSNRNGMFDRSEVIAAINRYLDGVAGITRPDVIAVIRTGTWAAKCEEFPRLYGQEDICKEHHLTRRSGAYVAIEEPEPGPAGSTHAGRPG